MHTSQVIKIMELNMKEYITITDDKNKKHTFYSFRELVEYLNSFTMSFLPDNFSYEIKKNGVKNG